MLTSLYDDCSKSLSSKDRQNLIHGLLYKKPYTTKGGEAFLRCLPLDIRKQVDQKANERLVERLFVKEENHWD